MSSVAKLPEGEGTPHLAPTTAAPAAGSATTVIIEMPLVRHVMPKRELRGFLRMRQQGHGGLSKRMSLEA